MQDSDFQEGMFARQIAVMKGQAWNVVETLKTPDHGPLELTRRVRVCVWDDLVDIPVAARTGPATDNAKRKQEVRVAKNSQEQSQDISVGMNSTLEPDHPLMDLSPRADRTTSPNRFNFSRPEAARRYSDESDIASQSGGNGEPKNQSSAPRRKIPEYLKHVRPSSQRGQTRASYDEPRRRWLDEDTHKRNFSFSTRRLDLDDDDMEGDLGFAAARDMDNNNKKVIVERLETVKSKNPVFTWC